MARKPAGGPRADRVSAGPARPGAGSPLPTRDALLAFIREAPGKVGKREIARAFGIRGPDRVALKAMLVELEREGAVERGRRRRLDVAGALPEVGVLQVVEIDADGDVLARPARWEQEADPPRIEVAPDSHGARGPAVGDRILARLQRNEDGSYTARVIRRLDNRAPDRIVAVYREAGGGGRLVSTDRRSRSEFRVPPGESGGAEPGELVLAEPLPRAGRLGLAEARVVERLGDAANPKAISLIAIQSRGIPVRFPAPALQQADSAEAAPPGAREDLRDIPLVTIDDIDARDYDDAVWAEPDPDPANPGGFHLLVAIADVAWYVRPDDPLDRAARERGNSVYFPDRVVPMLPEALSNGWCSLRPNEDRPCMAIRMWIDAEGNMLRHKVLRGLMRSAARLTYQAVQDARDGRPDDQTGPLLEPVIGPLYAAFEALLQARERRGTLELDLPERRILLDDAGRIARVEPRPRFDSHRLIEEFMIAANVAAAETLEGRQWPCMYRVHDRPDPLKVEALRESLATMGLKVARGQVLKPAHFNALLQRAAGTPNARVVSDLVLRSQAQAVYSPENLGHFGLALPRYAHFTSPIRRYADLLVHRGLIGALELGPGGTDRSVAASYDDVGQHISATERRAAAAERETVDRFTAAWMADRVGADFAGRISGVTRFGLFVTLEESGADGLVPVATLPGDYYDHDPKRHCLAGRQSGRTYTLGETVQVRLAEADALTGGILLHLLTDGAGGTGGRRPPAGAAAARRRSPRRR